MTPSTIARFSVGPIGSAAIGLATIPLLAWIFPAEAIGRFAMLQVATSLCLLLFGLGLEQACVREYHQSEDRIGLFKMSILPGLLLLLMSIGAFVVVSPQMLSNFLFGYRDSSLEVYSYVCFLAAFVLRFLSLIVRLEEKGIAFSMTQLLPKLIFSGMLVFYYLSNGPFEFKSLLVAQTIAILTAAGVYLWITRSSLLIASPSVDWPLFRRQIKFGVPLAVSGLSFWGMTSFDRISLRHFSDFHELGLYAIAVSFAGVALIVQSIFQTVWTPMVFRWHSEGIEAFRIHRMTSRILGIVVSFICLAGLFSWCVEFLLPSDFHNSQYLIPACLIVPLFFTLSETAGIGLGIVRKSAFAMAAALIALCISVVSNMLLVPNFGAAGAASATAVSFLVLVILRTELANLSWIPMPRRRLYALTTTLTTLSIGFALLGPHHAGLFACFWAGLLLFSLVSFRKDLLELVLWIKRRAIF